MQLIHHKDFESSKNLMNPAYDRFNITLIHSYCDSDIIPAYAPAKDYEFPDDKLVINGKDNPSPVDFFGLHSKFRSS